jgi:hypothetical protein
MNYQTILISAECAPPISQARTPGRGWDTVSPEHEIVIRNPEGQIHRTKGNYNHDTSRWEFDNGTLPAPFRYKDNEVTFWKP